MKKSKTGSWHMEGVMDELSCRFEVQTDERIGEETNEWLSKWMDDRFDEQNENA